MIEPVIADLVKLGVPRERIEFESFTSPKHDVNIADAPADGGGEAVDTKVTFTNAGESTDIAADQTILEAAEDIGVEIPFDCRSGICGTCKVKLLRGRVKMETQDALTDDDRKDNIILACQARCLEEVEVEA